MAPAPAFYNRWPPSENLKASFQRNPGAVKSQWILGPK
jgi:hypothetical protein